MIWYLQGLKATQLRGDPHTLIVLTTTPLSELITMRWPSVLPTAKATPNGWKHRDMHSKETYKSIIGKYKLFAEECCGLTYANNRTRKSYTDDLALFFGSEQELQNSIIDLEAACMNIGTTISKTKTQVMHFGFNRKTSEWMQTEWSFTKYVLT